MCHRLTERRKKEGKKERKKENESRRNGRDDFAGEDDLGGLFLCELYFGGVVYHVKPKMYVLLSMTICRNAMHALRQCHVIKSFRD